MPRRDLRFAILALGVTQIVGYGGLYYAFAVLAPAITSEFGWSSAWTYGAFSAGLLAGGLAAPFAGRAIDRFGAPTMMAIGSALAALAVLTLANASNLPTYFLGMIAVEVVSTLVLYDAAFTLLTQMAGREARAAITKLTLIAGFASTIFWPLTVQLATVLTWREIYMVYAGLCLVICLPLHALLRPGVARAQAAARSTAREAGPLPAAAASTAQPRRTFWLVAIFFATGGFIVSVLSVHMLEILKALGFPAATATLISMLQGPSQVGARLVEFTFASRLSPRATAIVSAALIPVGLLALGAATLGPIAGAFFALCYGAGLGLNSIVRGTLPLWLFGARGYGAMMGKLSAPGLAVKAAAPLAFAVMHDAFGLTAALAGLVVVALASLASVVMLPSGRTDER